jgi:UDP-N-acetylmuramoyl-L-alanyl-D-glutamate--2,6-diaminopimelate ligase
MKDIGEIVQIMETLKVRKSAGDTKVTSVCYDSRLCVPGSAFVAVKGAVVDGHDFIGAAVQRGATAVIAERDPANFGVALPDRVTLALVPDSRVALARLADYFYDAPSSRLSVAGVTGTNGKTTVTYLIQSILNAAGTPCGRIGTTGYDLIGAAYDAPNTTPESADIHRMLAELIGHGGKGAAMEVSSHALTQHRVDHVRFATAVFTNLTQDHLDYHGDMDAYFMAKARLFTEGRAAVAVINIDDRYAARLLPMIDGDLMTYGLEGFADVTAENLRVGVDGIAMTLKTPRGSVPVRSRLGGRYNVYNILAAAAAGLAQGADVEAVARGVADLAAAPGRFERIDAGQAYAVIVDYAHTDDALVNVLTAAREVTKGRLITLFGCGGDRDAGKRPKMGRAAWRLSDVVVVTSDNPRTESPSTIIDQILTGIDRAENVGGTLEVIGDRREAIIAAVAMAEPGDTVVIAGKGHEDYQIVGKDKHHFDDREEAREAIRRRNAGV